jgi:predicted MFS family arabinose efflux permease
MVAAGLFGVATGMVSPAVTAWTVDLSHPDYRGRALATMYIALEAGIGGGALLAGWIYGNRPGMIPVSFYVSAALAFLAFLYVVFVYRKPVVPVEG